MNDSYLKFKLENRKRINDYMIGQNDGNVDFYPSYIQLEQTNRCNAECIMCNHFFLGNRGAQDINTTVIEKLTGIFPYCETLMLNGDGEPFFSKNIVDQIVRYKSYGMKIGTNTNLCFIPETCWPILGDSFSFLNISCDGANKETFELIRKGLSYDKFLENLEKLNSIAPQLGKNLDCVVMRENIDETVELVIFAKVNGFKSIRFHRLGINPCIGNGYDSDAEFEKYAAEVLMEAKKKADEMKITIQIPNYILDAKEGIFLSSDSYCIDREAFRQLIDQRQLLAKKKYGDLSLSTDYFSSDVTIDELEYGWNSPRHCQWAVERIYVDLKGNVSTCCFNVKKKMGNILENSFDEIWNGEKYRQLRTLMAKKQLPNFCKECNWIKEGKF